MPDWIDGLGVNEWVAIGSALIAVLSFAFNWAVVRRQMAMQYESLRAQMDAEMMAWARDAIDLVSDGVRLAQGRGAAYTAEALRPLLLETSQRLSAIADRGRLFFPNVDHTKHGQDKEKAFQGFRPVILDAVIFAHYQVDKIDPSGAGPDQPAAEYLVKCRRLLVSEVQGAVDPRRRGKMLKRLSVGAPGDHRASFRDASALAEDLRIRFPELPIGARGPEWIERREKVRG